MPGDEHEYLGPDEIEDCPYCDGTGEDDDGNSCSCCGGTGFVRKD